MPKWHTLFHSIRDYKLNANWTQLVNVLSLDFMRVSGNKADTFERDGWKRFKTHAAGFILWDEPELGWFQVYPTVHSRWDGFVATIFVCNHLPSCFDENLVEIFDILSKHNKEGEPTLAGLEDKVKKRMLFHS